jgi:hypothetical protein
VSRFSGRARGDGRPDFNCAVAVFLHVAEGLWHESSRVAAIEADILFDTGAVISALPFADGD